MNAIEQYDSNNIYYKISIVDSTGIQNIYIESFDNSIYKSRVDFGDGVVRNATGIAIPNSGGTFGKNYTTPYKGYIKLYANKLKVKKIFIDAGLDFQNNSLDTYKNVIITPEIIEYFPNLEYFRFQYYCYNSKNPIFKGKVTGEWASRCGNNLKVLNISSNYPSDNATFNLELIPSNSIIEEIRLQPNSAVTNFTVSGSVTNLPSTCRYVNLGADVGVTSTTNNVTGVIPPFVEVFKRTGRNNITADIGSLVNLKELNLSGSNTVYGTLSNYPNISEFFLLGNNTITGNLNSLINITNIITITGFNKISGTIPSLLKVKSLDISGTNEISGTVPISIYFTDNFTINGNNTLTGTIDLVNARNVNIGGQNTISNLILPNSTFVSIGGLNVLSDINLPKIQNINIQGNNTITGDIYNKINSFMTGSLSIGGQNTISSISGIFTNVVGVNITGNNTLTGDILSKFPIATNISILGNNTINQYTSRTYPSIMNIIDIQGQASLTIAMVDQIFIDLARDATTWTGSKLIRLKGNCQPPSSDSSLARSILKDRFVSIITN